jgi:hypothetical protein
MDIEITWYPPLPLTDGSAEDLIYTVDENELKAWDGCPGVYMFCRMFNGSVIPMYIGRSKNLYNRIWEHLETTSLMRRIESESKGERVLMIGEYMPALLRCRCIDFKIPEQFGGGDMACLGGPLAFRPGLLRPPGTFAIGLEPYLLKWCTKSSSNRRFA